MKKRLLVFLLTIIMVLTMMPISAKAEEEKKFKAVYDSNAESLTFYYDSIDHSGQVFDNLPTAATIQDDWPYFKDVMHEFMQVLKSVIFDKSIQEFHGLTSTAFMFNEFIGLESIIGLEYLDTSEVTNMECMFFDCESLTSVPGVSSWNTSKVTNMEGMFQYCESMTTVPDVSNWVTTNLEDAGSMFSNYGKNSSTLNAVPDVSNWDTTNLKNAERMFENYALNSTELEFVLDLSGWNMPAYEYNFWNVGLIDDSTAKNAKKWTVIIPPKTGEEPNKANAWKVNDTNTFTPPTGKVFTVPNIISNDIPDTDKDTNHGYISVPKNSLPGATVSMTVFPNSEYYLKTDSLKVSYNDGTTKTCELTPDATDETKYTFTMPGFDVTVTAEFVHNTHVFSGDYMEYDKTNHKWAKKCDCGEFDTANSLTGVEIPQAETGLIYNGEKQVSITKDYTDCCLIENYIAADAGRYIAKCTLDDGYIWSDGTTEVKNIEWEIAPMQLQDATAKNEEYTGTKITPTLSFSVADLVLGTDYTVGEWSGDLIEPGTYTAKVTFIGNYTGSANVSLTIKGANKSVVKFDLNNGATGGPENRMIDNGNKFSEPEAPTCEGYTFAGWYTDKNCTDGNEYDFESEVTKDIVLYAKWIKNTDPDPDEVKKTDLLNIELANKINEAAKQGKTVVIYLTEYTGNDCLTRDNLKLLTENPNVILVLDYTFFDVDTKKDIHVHAVINKANISPVLNDDVKYFGPANLSGFVQYYNMLPAEIRNMNL